ncbi:MAG TPA: thioredoxin-like domain-containing protein [Chthoniobacterales bacterium]|jgi:nucleoredoxin
MNRFPCLVLIFAFAAVVDATPMPLTANEISLMLRTGYSSKAVLQELTNRKFADTLEPDKERKLMLAGASPELIFALRSGGYTVSAEEAAHFQQQKEMEAKHRAAAESHAAQPLLAQVRPADGMQQGIYQQVKGDLVQFRNGGVSRFDDGALGNKKYFLIYFSAHWCGPCRKFTPGLVNYYNDTIAKHPEFELIFVSNDKSAFGMETYMREMNMPWPAIDFQKVAQKTGIRKYAGQGIPDLVLVDSSGNILADSYRSGQYVGPKAVLHDLDGILTNGSSTEVAQAR